MPENFQPLEIGGLKCEETAKLVSMYKYQCTTDNLEGLVVD